MKVKTGRTTPTPIENTVDLKELFEKFSDQYSQVFMESVDDQVFIFKALGRKDFKDLVESKEVNDCAKEEIVCELCTLYPKNYDFENCEEAGLPTELCRIILDHSLLKSSDQLQKAIHYFRDKLEESLDEQITCVIHEAFPEFPVEDIANWDVVKTADYMTRAEYILHNLRGVPLTPVQIAPEQEDCDGRFPSVGTQAAPQQEVHPLEDETMETPQPQQKKAPEKPLMKKGAKNTLTPEKYRQLMENTPDDVAPIDWLHDSVAMNGVSALMHQSFDDRPLAEIPVDGSEDGQDAIPLALRDKFKVIKRT